MRKQTNNTELLKLRDELAATKYPVVVKGTVWKDTRHSTTEYVLVDKVKTNHIQVKRHKDAADSITLNPACFHKKYTPCVGDEGKDDVRLS